MNNLALITGNLCSLIAMVTDSVSASRKTAKAVLLMQSLSQLFYCLGTIVLKGYSGAVQNAMGILRNLMVVRNIQNKLVEWTLVILGVALGLWFNNRGLMGLLPVIANLQYTLVVFHCKDNDRILKFSFLISVILFAIFNFVILNVIGAISSLVIAVSTAAALIRTAKNG